MHNIGEIDREDEIVSEGMNPEEFLWYKLDVATKRLREVEAILYQVKSVVTERITEKDEYIEKLYSQINSLEDKLKTFETRKENQHG